MKTFAAIVMLALSLATAGAASATTTSDACMSADFATRFWCEASLNGS